MKVNIFNKLFMFLFGLTGSLLFGLFFLANNVNAYSLEGWVDGDLSCKERSTKYDCSVNIYAGITYNTNPNWTDVVPLYTRITSDYRGSQDFFLGNRVSWSQELQDYSPKYNVYNFSISKDDIKRYGYSTRRGNYEVWSLWVEVDHYDWWGSDWPREDGWGDFLDDIEITVEERVSNTLTIKAIDTNGWSLSSIIPDATVEVDPGGRAQACIGTANGYTKIKWGRSTSSYTWWDDTGLCYDAGYIESDTTIYAVYERDEFSGRARVFEGEGTDSANNASTGYVEYDKTVSIDMECPNDGCRGSFDLAMKREKGSGLAYYTGRIRKNGLLFYLITSPLSPFSPSTSGTLLDIKSYYYAGGDTFYRNYASDTLHPGETYCFSIAFQPYGSYSNDKISAAEACARAKESSFQGKIGVSGGTTGDTGWKSSNDSQSKILTSCTYAKPCTVNFQHYLRRTSGIGFTDYTIKRTSNYSVVSNSVLKNNVTEYFINLPNNTGVKEADDNDITLVPGQMVCETLTFKPSNNVIDVKPAADIEYCVMATGNAQPPDPTDSAVMEDGDLSNAFLDMRVKNNSGADKYKKFQKIVYAKPGDILTYRGTYNPILQYSYLIIPQTMQIDGGATITNNGYYLYSLFNNKNTYTWKNAFSIRSNENFSFSQNYSYSVGNTLKRKETNDYTVVSSKVGKKLVETAQTNLNNITKTTPSQVTFTASGSNINANVITATKSSAAEARVPYNFDTKVEVIVPEDKQILYSGEEDEFSYIVNVEKRVNPETTNGDEKDAYATIVPDSISKLIIYRPSSGGEKGGTSNYGSSKTDDLCRYYSLTNNGSTCKYDNEKNQMLNASGNRNGSSDKYKLSYNVPDIPAGSKICVAVATYPSNSGEYTNFSDPEGNHRWRISDSKCYIIAKRPTFQVWGGSAYSGGAITTSVMHKKTLGGLPEFTGTFVFSSWVEQSVTAKGRVIALASGAASGLANNIAGGGSLEVNADYCKHRVPLSIGNYSNNIVSGICPSAQMTGSSGISAITINRDSIIARLPNEDSLVNEYTGNTTIVFNNGTPKNVVRYNVKGNVVLNSSTISVGRTHIVNATGDITIAGNITYQDMAFTSLSDIQKLIIYGRNITIGCAVSRIDAVIIAEEDVNTCASENINLRLNSHQLKINGSIIANKLFLNRTYGAATGVNSKVPAEVVNYDVSTILWGRAKADPDNKHRNLTAVYTHELAPRY